MILSEVLHLLIEDGIEDARHRQIGASRPDVLRGTMDAYGDCRLKEPGDLKDMLATAAIARVEAARTADPDHEYRVGYETAVEFVASVMSCALEYHRLPPITKITLRARTKYASIVGYEDMDATKKGSPR